MCGVCNPFSCEACGQITSVAFKKRKAGFKLDKQALAIMGTETSRRQCPNCGKPKEVGSNGLCYNCIKGNITDIELVCEYCNELSSESLAPWKFKRSGVCSQCMKALALNEHGVCKNCHSNFVQSRKKCWNCRNYFTSTYADDTHCVNCKEKCATCDDWFNPKTKLHAHCPKCVDKMAKNVCVKCNKRYENNSKSGYCDECELPQSSERYRRNFCRICHINEVEGIEEMCESCHGKTVICPGCGKNTIYAAEWICKTCKTDG